MKLSKFFKTIGEHRKEMFLVLLLLVIDQITKYAFFDLTLFNGRAFVTPIFNKLASFGIGISIYIIYVVSIFSLLFFFHIYKKDHISHIEVVLFVAGTAGNLIDRIFLGGVRDFIDLKFWPIFNFADIFLTCGFAYFVYREFLKSKKSKLK